MDGVQVGGVLPSQALRGSGQSDTVTVRGDWAPGGHTATINFLNDVYGGTPATDRNLFVHTAAYNGAAVPNAFPWLGSAGPRSFGFTDSSPIA